jgi:hypothetical protein
MSVEPLGHQYCLFDGRLPLHRTGDAARLSPSTPRAFRESCASLFKHLCLHGVHLRHPADLQVQKATLGRGFRIGRREFHRERYRDALFTILFFHDMFRIFSVPKIRFVGARHHCRRRAVSAIATARVFLQCCCLMKEEKK